MAGANIFQGAYDSGQVPVESSTNWTKVLIVDVSKGPVLLGVDIAVSANPVNLLLTRAAKPNEQHVPYQADFRAVGIVVESSTLGNPSNASMLGNGTVNQPAAGDIVSLNINTAGCAEVAIWAMAVSTPAVVRAYGQCPGIEN